MGIVTLDQIEAAARVQMDASNKGVRLALADVLVQQGIVTQATRENVEKKKPSSSVLFTKKTPYQVIKLAKHQGGYLFTLNGSLQVHTNEEKLYHEAFATAPMMLAEKVERVVILGGGDGMAARNVLHFPEVKDATLIELDEDVLDLCSTHEVWSKLNEGALTNKRLKVVCGDAIAWFLKSKKKFDVILHDIEDTETDQPSAISLEMYQSLFYAIRDKLAPGGVLVTTVASDDQIDAMLIALFEAQSADMPPKIRAEFKRKRTVEGRTEVLLKTIFPHVLNWPVEFPVLGRHTMFYASHKPIKKIQRWPDVKP